jgi:hypothetical protein
VYGLRFAFAWRVQTKVLRRVHGFSARVSSPDLHA